MDTLIIDAKSGTSGAGRGAKVQNLYCEVNESIKAYGVASHRHTPEIEEQLGYVSSSKVLLNFTPHLIPMNRGILITAYASLKEGVSEEDVKNARLIANPGCYPTCSILSIYPLAKSYYIYHMECKVI